MVTGKAYPAIKECDLLGRYPAEVNEALLDLAGGNFGRQVREVEFAGWEHPVVIVGGDGRRSTASLKRRILAALAGQGCAAISLPVATPTPIAYWAKNRRKAQAVPSSRPRTARPTGTASR